MLTLLSNALLFTLLFTHLIISVNFFPFAVNSNQEIMNWILSNILLFCSLHMRVVTLSRKLWRECLSSQFEWISAELSAREFRKSLRHNLVYQCFLYRGSVISWNKPVRTSFRDKQDVCPGYDKNGDVPTRCFFTKGDLIDMDVLHQ